MDDDATVGKPAAGQKPGKQRAPQVQRLVVEGRTRRPPEKEPDQGTESEVDWEDSATKYGGYPQPHLHKS